MKKKKSNLFIGTILLICIIVPLFYFTLGNDRLFKTFNKTVPPKDNIGLNDTNINKNKVVLNNNEENSHMMNSDSNITSSGIRDIRIPHRFFMPFIFKYFRKPSIVSNYVIIPNNDISVQPELPGTIQSPTNNEKPIPQKSTTKRISPNIVETPSSYPKDKTKPDTTNPTPIPNYPKENIIKPAPTTPQVSLVPTENNTKEIVPTPAIPKENIKSDEVNPLPQLNNIDLQDFLKNNVPQAPMPSKNIEPMPPKDVVPTQPKVQNTNLAPVSHTNVNSLSDVEQAIFNQVNVERSKVGLPLLSYNKTMEKYARIKSKDMGDKNYFSHEDLQGNLITVQMHKDGVKYKAWGENIASKSGSINVKHLSDQFMTKWMNSSGHRANILSTDFQSIGVGLYQIGNEVFATQEFYK